MKNHFDKNGNYINVENLSLAEIYHRGYQDGSEDGLNDIRPHGEWIPDPEVNVFIRCSVCNELETWKYPFCPHCGADMRGDDHD